MHVHIARVCKIALWYLLWPFAAAYDLARSRALDKPNWLVAAIVGAIILFFLREAVFVALPSRDRTIFIVTLIVLYLAIGHGFRSSIKQYSLWEF